MTAPILSKRQKQIVDHFATFISEGERRQFRDLVVRELDGKVEFNDQHVTAAAINASWIVKNKRRDS